MKRIKRDWFTWIIILAPFVFALVNWDKFPDRIATHFNIKGEPDDYSSKTFALILFPSINIILYALFLVLPFLDPRKKNYALFEYKWRIIRTVLHAFLSFITLATFFFALGYKVDIGMYACYGITVLMLVFGNYLGNIRPNWFIGIRLPWTLENETVWVMTHRFAGRLWVTCSLLMLPVYWFFPQMPWLLMPYIFFITLAPMIYSYIKYKQMMKGNNSAHDH